MERVDAMSVGGWIRPRLTGRWGSLTALVPAGYPAYVRILHPVLYGDQVLKWSGVAAVTGRNVHPLVQWWRLVDATDSINPVSTLFDGDHPKPDTWCRPQRSLSTPH